MAKQKLVELSNHDGVWYVKIGYMSGVTPKKFALELDRCDCYAHVSGNNSIAIVKSDDSTPPAWAVAMAVDALVLAELVAVDTRDGTARSCIIVSSKYDNPPVGTRIPNPDPMPLQHTTVDAAGQ